MGITSQLYQLQETDLEIEAQEQALSRKSGQLGERQALDMAQDRLTAAQQRLGELKQQQHGAEWEVDDVMSKIAAAEEQLYSGKITNPKELSGLQHEVNTLKAKRDQLETKALEIIDQVEAAEKSATTASDDFRKLEGEWCQQQQQLSDEIEQLKISLSSLKQKRQQLSEGIEKPAVELYEKTRQNKKPPVARVEQGICRICRISLSASEVQRVRSGNPILCGSCGRILFLP
ncbi:zinc ribbon domain-containing protein [Chloroflexota bacterium]